MRVIGAVAWLLAASLCAQEMRPVGKTKEDQQRNAVLLSGYDYSKYGVAITGYTGQDRQRIAVLNWYRAVRTRVGPIGNYKAGMARLKNGKLIIAVCREREGRSDFDILVYESSDDGLTWRPINKSPLCGKEPSVTALPDDSLILTVQGGKVGCGPDGVEGSNPLSRSTDGGVTWETQQLPGLDYPRNLIVEKDGSLLMIRAFTAPGKNAEETGPDFELCRSKDGGKRWSCEVSKVPWDSRHGEVSAIRLRNGRLLAVTRRSIPGTYDGHGYAEAMLTESRDDGKTWSEPRIMSNTAEVHTYLTELRDGRVLASYTNYHLPFGTSAIVSHDGGNTWTLGRPIQLALSVEAQGGWPVTLELPDGSLVTAHAVTTYSKQAKKWTCEVVRWRVP